VELVFDAFSDSEPVKRAQEGSDMTALGRFDDSTSKRVLDLLETGIIETQGVYSRDNYSNQVWSDR